MNKNESSFVGKTVSITLLDRTETRWEGACLESLTQLGATVSYSSRGNEFLDFIPIASISHIGWKSGSASKEQIEVKSS